MRSSHLKTCRYLSSCCQCISKSAFFIYLRFHAPTRLTKLRQSRNTFIYLPSAMTKCALTVCVTFLQLLLFFYFFYYLFLALAAPYYIYLLAFFLSTIWFLPPCSLLSSAAISCYAFVPVQRRENVCMYVATVSSDTVYYIFSFNMAALFMSCYATSCMHFV